MLVLAQLPDPSSYTGIGWLLVAIAALLGILNQGGQFFDRFRAKDPNPPLHKEYATKDEHNVLAHEFAKFRDEVRVSFDDAAEVSRQSREKIYLELRRHGELIVACNERAALTHERVQKFDDKLDRLTARHS